MLLKGIEGSRAANSHTKEGEPKQAGLRKGGVESRRAWFKTKVGEFGRTMLCADMIEARLARSKSES